MTELVKVDATILSTAFLNTDNVKTDSADSSDDTVALTLNIPTDLDYFKGHFDQAPILAGVVQLHWAVEYAKQYLVMGATDVMNIQVLKFQEMILPGQDVVLTLTKKSAEKVLFSYQSTTSNGDIKSHSSGRLIFAETVAVYNAEKNTVGGL
ncbi:hypothetical protein HWV01_14760 [Moritella sp. 5]|uniref:ApeI family dehydratase n=1 Tax=Moritella sp. 5 TaxID=2746231 RepID=UPI001BAA3A5B|nr:hypothetical protein [Moritella sp. 5]QUM81453.1 hypothetical protein HWV01_14760 [Moritella sp. 5]